MRISAVVPVFDGARWLAAALESARAQTLPPDEIVVVDDGSTDDSAAIARAVPGVRVVTQPHAGVAAARNRGLDEARGELIAWLDADDLWMPDKLAIQVALLDERPELDYVLGHQRYLVEPGVPIPAWIPDGDVTRETPLYGTCTMLVRATAFARVGRFDERRLIAEDSDWLARARDAGVLGTVVERALIQRRVHDRNLSSRYRSREAVFSVLRASIARKRGP